MGPLSENSRLLQAFLPLLALTALFCQCSGRDARLCAWSRNLPGDTSASGCDDEDAAVMLQSVRHQQPQAVPTGGGSLPLVEGAQRAPSNAPALLGTGATVGEEEKHDAEDEEEDSKDLPEEVKNFKSARGGSSKANLAETPHTSGDVRGSRRTSQQKEPPAHGVPDTAALQAMPARKELHVSTAEKGRKQKQENSTTSPSGLAAVGYEAGGYRWPNHIEVKQAVENLRTVLFTQLGSAAKTVKSLTSPSDTIPSVLPFLAVLSVVLAGLLACWYTITTPRALDHVSNRPSSRQEASRTSFASWAAARPQQSRNSLPPSAAAVPKSLKDPYSAYANSSQGPKQSLLPVNQLTGKSLAAPSAKATPAPSLSLLTRPGTLQPHGNGSAEWAAGPEMLEELPPPLYAALVLPAREAQMEIPVDVLLEGREHGANRFFVLGPLGNKIMHVTFCGNAFDVHMAPPSSELVANVSLQVSADRPRLEICGPDGTVYGHILENQQMGRNGQSSFSVVVRSLSGQAGHEMLLINGSPEQLRLTATAAENGQPVASAARQTKRNGQNLDIRTQRGADVALVLSCFLGILLLQPRNGQRASKGSQR